jgi:plasmid stabilization system protein ParE
VPEFDQENLREVFASSYRIIYRVEGETVTIAAVVHGKRDLDLALRT